MRAGDMLARMMGGGSGRGADPAAPPRRERAPAYEPDETDADELGPDDGEPDDADPDAGGEGDEAAQRAIDALQDGDASGFKRAVCEMLDAEGYG